MILKKIIDQRFKSIVLIQEINVWKSSIDERMPFDCFLYFTDMDYEFLVRTADNVEIILDVSIFWQITDLYKLVLVTQDPPEDICKF